MSELPRQANETASYVPPHGSDSRVGPYKLLQQIGEGGMGVVFMAEQEQPVRRRVALKIIKPGMDSAHVIARFKAEQQALALMDHQNIAKVYDAGTTEQGRPYFVMELVHGVPITKYCDDNKLTPRERLELFVPVCRAVQHAHQKGIIHRDLKPSNVLVCLNDGKPVAKVIDFGVAKAMEQPLTDATMFTQFGQIVGTLEYMSPEQAEMSQLGIDTRSDIYSLGVMLYELLTGSTPLQRHRVKQAAFDEVLKLIREEEPPLPSSRLSSSTETLPTISQRRRMEPAQLTRLVRGELDWIVMKALEKDRTRRYDTASAFAQDIERHLADEPVEACPPSRSYLLRKYAHKHRALLTTAAAFALVLLAGTGVSVWQAVQAIQAKSIAVQAREDADKAGKEALKDRDDAVKARDEAVKARNEAIKARDSEVEAHLDAFVSGLKLAEANDRLRRALYAADMNLVRVAWEADNPMRALALLDSQIPDAGKTDLRGFEWHYWKRQFFTETRRVPLEGHPSEKTAGPGGFRAVLQYAFSPSGRRCAANVDSRLHVWDMQTGRLIKVIPEDPDGLPKLVGFSDLEFAGSDERILMSSLKSHALIDVVSGKILHANSGNRPFLHSDGKHLLTTRKDELVWLDLETGQDKHTVAVPDVRNAHFSGDGSRVAWFVSDEKNNDEIRVVETKTGKLVNKVPAPAGGPFALFTIALSRDGKHLMVGPRRKGSIEGGKKARLPADYRPLEYWDVDKGKALWTRTFPKLTQNPTLVLSPDHRFILIREQFESKSSIDSERAYLIDTATGLTTTPLSGAAQDSQVRDTAVFSPCGNVLALASKFRTFSFYATLSGHKIFEAKVPAKLVDLSLLTPHVTFSTDGKQFTAIISGTAHVWDASGWIRRSLLPSPPGPSRIIKFSKPEPGDDGTTSADRYRMLATDGRLMATLERRPEDMGEWTLHVRRTIDDHPIHTRGPFPVTTVLAGFDGANRVVLVVPTDKGREVRLMDLAANRQSALWTLEKEPVAPTKGGSSLLKGGPPVRAVFLAEGERVLVMDRRAAPAPEVDFDTKKKLLSSSPSFRLRFTVLDMAKGERVASWLDDVDDAIACTLSRNQRSIALLRLAAPLAEKLPDGRVRIAPRRLLIAETDSGRVFCEAPDLEFAGNDIAYSPDSRLVAIWSSSIVQVRNASTGLLCFKHSEPDGGSTTHVLFTPDSRRLVLGKRDVRQFASFLSGVRLLDVEEGNQLGYLSFDRVATGPLQFTPDGHRLIGVRPDWRYMPPGERLEVIDATPVAVKKQP